MSRGAIIFPNYQIYSILSIVRGIQHETWSDQMIISNMTHICHQWIHKKDNIRHLITNWTISAWTNTFDQRFYFADPPLPTVIPSERLFRYADNPQCKILNCADHPNSSARLIISTYIAKRIEYFWFLWPKFSSEYKKYIHKPRPYL